MTDIEGKGPGQSSPVLNPDYEVIRKMPYANTDDYDYLCYNQAGVKCHMRRADIEQQPKRKFKREDLL
jgi:hypothetical protein